jgi:hypothetical protein
MRKQWAFSCLQWERAMHNQELAASLEAIARQLERVIESLSPPLPIDAPQPRAPGAGSYPWSPGTENQGFLAARFERRDGTIYGPSATQADTHINTPIAGGDDAQARVDVPSGEPKS